MIFVAELMLWQGSYHRRIIMKRKLVILLLAVFTLSACGSDAGSDRGRYDGKEEKEEKPTKEDEDTEDDPLEIDDPDTGEDDPEPDEEPDDETDTEVFEELTEDELYEINCSDFNCGFFLSDYQRPEEIDWYEVFYNGAGIEQDLTDEEWEYINENYNDIGIDFEALSKAQISEYMELHTECDSRYAENPVTDDWEYVSEYDLYVFFHGDTNMVDIDFTHGFKAGDVYHLFYYISDWRHNNFDDVEYEAVVRIENDGNWVYISNLCVDNPTKETLVDMLVFEDKEDAEAYDPLDWIETDSDLIGCDPDERFYWIVVKAEDNVKLTLDYADLDNPMGIIPLHLDCYIPGTNAWTGNLDAGDCIVIHTPLTWSPTMRLFAQSGEFSGSYWLGEDTWRGADFDDGYIDHIFITGHNLAAEGRVITAGNALSFYDATYGTWAYYNDYGELTAILTVDDYSLTVTTLNDIYEVGLSLENGFNDNEVPDLISLYSDNDEIMFDLPGDIFTNDEMLGDYMVGIIQEDGLQRLIFEQGSNDGALSYLIPGADASTTDFEFVRYEGVPSSVH